MKIPPKSRYKEKLEFLLKNQNISRIPLCGNLFPNCHGTSLWILGASGKIKENPRLVINKGDDLNKLSKATFPLTDTPFYAGSEVLRWFIDRHGETVRSRQEDSLFVIRGLMESLDGLDYEDDLHSGIFLGGDEGVCFEQHERGSPFRLLTLDELIHDYSYSKPPEFYKIKI